VIGGLFEKAIQQKQYFNTSQPHYSEIEKDSGHDHSHLTLDEESALRYIAGYICRKVHKKIEKSSHKNKEDMALLMIEFYGR
jgi:hypothetical protein